MTGPEIKAARERAHLTQAQLAEQVGVGLRTVSNWERGETVPKNRMAALEALLLPPNGEDPLRTASDTELLAEVARRFTQHGRAAG